MFINQVQITVTMLFIYTS